MLFDKHNMSKRYCYVPLRPYFQKNGGGNGLPSGPRGKVNTILVQNIECWYFLELEFHKKFTLLYGGRKGRDGRESHVGQLKVV